MEKRLKKSKELLQTTGSWTCEHCNVTFSRISIDKHLCEKKRRYLARDNPIETLAYKMWLHIQHIYFDIKYFENSLHYISFVSFAKFCIENQYINPLEFTAWVLRNKVPMVSWRRFEIYRQFVSSYIGAETPEHAIERSIDYIKSKNMLGEYFSSGGCNRILEDIEYGRVSPWIVLLSDATDKLLPRMNDEQVDRFFKLININMWEIKINRLKDEVEPLKSLLKQVAI